MDTQQKIEFIRSKCILANPEILNLEFGCEVKTKDNKNCVFVVNDVGGYCFLVYSKHRFYEKKDFEIIGRPIRLADIMNAIYSWRKSKSIFVRHDGTFFEWEKFTEGGDGHHGVFSHRVQWDMLKDDLREQSKETLSFICELLK